MGERVFAFGPWGDKRSIFPVWDPLDLLGGKRRILLHLGRQPSLHRVPEDHDAVGVAVHHLHDPFPSPDAETVLRGLRRARRGNPGTCRRSDRRTRAWSSALRPTPPAGEWEDLRALGPRRRSPGSEGPPSRTLRRSNTAFKTNSEHSVTWMWIRDLRARPPFTFVFRRFWRRAAR